jgi:hypothetical protein
MFPFALIGGYLLYEMLYNYQYDWSYYLIIPVLAIAAALALNPQIDEIGYKLWKPKADPTIQKIILASSPSSSWIYSEDYNVFFSKSLDQIRVTDFMGMKVDDIPTDVKVMCIFPGLLLDYLFGTKLLKEYDRVVLYKSPFPSPQFNEWHTSEVHHEDGMIIMSLAHLIPNYSRAHDFYHICWDAWLRAFFLHHPELTNKSIMSETTQWGKPNLDIISARKYLGLNHVDDVMINWQALLNYPELFREKHPKSFELIVNQMIKPPRA